MFSTAASMMAYSALEAVAVIAVGLVISYSGGRELLTYARARHRLERTSGTVVGLVDVGMFRANTKSYAARFRFTAADGRVVESVSSASTFPGPKVGKAVTVVYDPADPAGTAERAGVGTLKVVLSPLLVLGGGAFVAWGVSLL